MEAGGREDAECGQYLNTYAVHYADEMDTRDLLRTELIRNIHTQFFGKEFRFGNVWVMNSEWFGECIKLLDPVLQSFTGPLHLMGLPMVCEPNGGTPHIEHRPASGSRNCWAGRK